MTRNILRSAIAAVIGIVVAFGLIWLAQYAGSEISPDVYDPDSGEVLIPIGSTVALVVGWFIGTFGGSWLAMRVSAGTGAGWIVAGLGHRRRALSRRNACGYLVDHGAGRRPSRLLRSGWPSARHSVIAD